VLDAREQDYKALRFCVERSHGTPLSKSRFLKKLDKRWREGRLLPDTKSGQWRKSLCCARILMGDYSRWDGWEFRSDYAATCWIERERLPAPMWDGSLVDRLFILAEEGLGDEVLFMSLLPEALLRAKRVTVECDKRLEGILRRSFPRTETVARKGTLTNIKSWAETQPPFNACLLMGDLARFFRKDKRHFPGKPYLKPDPLRVAEMERFRGRVGVSWSGNHGRYQTGMLVGVCGESRPLNLQYNETSNLVEEPGIDLKDDLEGLFALCAVLKRVVSVSTSIAHIAGSIGARVDVIHAPSGSGGKNDMDILNWKWPEGKNPWYGSATAYRNLMQYEMLRPR
jgi:hypothetical protein